ncbi:MAG: hypothetical protein L0Y56_12710, partial [Nitrospira sp.]|nr:hypothetical protein [Nitrospira sp.]
MAEVILQLITESPVMLGTRKPYGHFLESHTYVPGSFIQGALAELLLARSGYTLPGRSDQYEPEQIPKESAFYRLFHEKGDGILQFGHFY